ncbi:siderophore ABC transporter substrate-binding protein [uncultured Enterococcus sp.]|uniref:siderophore ABC transporter substrate-binding protein n=1 Tax=uncultured Enterococcus sp. TaxID=167972 RepID=UPI0025E0EBC3|nr:siderophore ABC transporter substrate-binding protein [uncultured Enterococcus sp.]
MKKIWSLVIVMSLGMIMAGCQKQTSAATDSKEKTIEIVDSTKQKVTVPVNAKKIVVFDSSLLDTVDALGEGDKVIGVPVKNLPTYLKQYGDRESVGGVKEPDLEKINALKPDLILIASRQADFKDELAKIAPTVYLATDTKDSWNSAQKNIETLASLFGKESEAKEKIAKIQTSIDALKAKDQALNARSLVVMTNENSLSAFGPGSRYGIVYDTFGLTPVDETLEPSTHGSSISYEYLLEKNPDYIFVVDRTKAIGGDQSTTNLADNALVKQTHAGKNQHVITLDPQVWYLAGSGLESLPIMIDEVSKGLN